ncbi:MAG: putative metal-binding motif-containing protein [Candidatus Polarisedimenticolia bacterium]
MLTRPAAIFPVLIILGVLALEMAAPAIADPAPPIPPNCPQFPPLNLPGVLCEGFDTNRNGVPGFQWSRLPLGPDPNDPLRAIGDPNDDVLAYSMSGGPRPLGTAGKVCADDLGFLYCHPVATENDWHLHSPFEGPGPGYTPPGQPSVGQADGGKAHSGVRSLHMGRHLEPFNTFQDTLRLRQVSAFVLDSQGDPNIPGLVPGPATTMEFWHIISVPDDENFGSGFIPAGRSFGGGQVQVSLMAGDGRFERWQRLTPGLNGYDSIIQETVSICGFDPGDDTIAPANETMCDNSPLWADLGDVFGINASCTTDTDGNDPLHKDCGAISGCTGGPGCTETGSRGSGVWARSTFDLSPFAGRVVRLRWIGMVEGGWSFGTQRSVMEPDPGGTAYNYYDGDDGWFLDDIRLTDLRQAPEPCTAVDDDADGFDECERDCDDANAAIYPGAPQVCGDDFNNDCDDPEWPLNALEADADGDGIETCEGDCDDDNPSVYPGAPEVCDGFNNDCNDPGWPVPHPGDVDNVDNDGDGFSECQGDCQDSYDGTYPGAPQVCGDGVNNDCNDPAWPTPPPDDADADHDGYSTCEGDCNDSAASVRPNFTQFCDGINNNCSDPSWPAVPANELDGDGDGHRPCGGDCDNTNPTVYPGAPELCDGIRNNCLGTWNPNQEIDNDGDGLSECQQDCDDANATSWAPPSGVVLLMSYDRSSGVTTFTWSPPAAPGGTQVIYDVLRAQESIDFPSAECLESDDVDTTATEPASLPPQPFLRFYLVRAQNGCPGTATGSIGSMSDGTPRVGRTCP